MYSSLEYRDIFIASTILNVEIYESELYKKKRNVPVTLAKLLKNEIYFFQILFYFVQT